ncbi:MAG: hypothetical protein WCC86_04505 [Methanoregula sp.]|uniref:hypothetical protein n=1 Tax=Methanoregula sp. TaxID=2052170 RepID=UPI003BB0B2DD
MKSKILVIGILLATVFALITGPVSAGGTSSGGAAVMGNPTSYAALTLNESAINMTPMTPGSSATNSTLGIIVTANEGSWTISVSDNTGRPSKQGYMGNWTAGNYVLSPLTDLASPIGLAGTANSTTSTNSITPPITSGATLYSGSAAVTNQLLSPNTFTQPVAYTDPILPTGNNYRIDLTFTLTYP